MCQIERDQRQTIKMIKGNASYESKLKAFGLCSLEVSRAEKMQARSYCLEEEFFGFWFFMSSWDRTRTDDLKLKQKRSGVR